MIGINNIDLLKSVITIDEIALALRQSYTDGVYSYQEIADLLGISREALYHIYNRNGLFVWDVRESSLEDDLETYADIFGDEA